MTHDSIGLGEDGPTHQPVEHLAALRAMPNMRVFRPADAVETAECWQLALERTDGPSLLALTRQNLPQVRKRRRRRELCATGAYELSPAARQGAARRSSPRAPKSRSRSRRRSFLTSRASPPASSRCPRSNCSSAQPEDVRAPDHRRCAGEGRGRGGGALRLGRGHRPGRHVRRHARFRRERALQGPLQALRHHPRGGGGTGPAGRTTSEAARGASTHERSKT